MEQSDVLATVLRLGRIEADMNVKLVCEAWTAPAHFKFGRAKGEEHKK